MIQIIQTLIYICLFRARPQDLPASGRTLGFAMIAAFVLSVIRITPISTGATPILIGLAQIALLAIGLKILLLLFSRRERWLQSATGVFGCSAVLMLAATPILMITESTGFGAAHLILVTMNIWSFVVIVSILRQTLEVRLWLAFLVTFVMEVIIAIIMQQMFGGQVI